MLYDIVDAQYVEDYKIKIIFENGDSGTVDFKPYINRGGVFFKFKDMNYFKSFHVDKEIGNISWQNEIDISPESLYSNATKNRLPEWMK